MSAATPFRVLVLCTGNSARSQIGEALLTTLGAMRTPRVVQGASAGSRPAARVNPYATAVLANHGIVWDGGTPKSIEIFEPFAKILAFPADERAEFLVARRPGHCGVV